MQDKIETTTEVTRVEIISEKGREFVKHGCHSVEIATQDNGRTLKIFLNRELDQNTQKV